MSQEERYDSVDCIYLLLYSCIIYLQIYFHIRTHVYIFFTHLSNVKKCATYASRNCKSSIIIQHKQRDIGDRLMTRCSIVPRNTTSIVDD